MESVSGLAFVHPPRQEPDATGRRTAPPARTDRASRVRGMPRETLRALGLFPCLYAIGGLLLVAMRGVSAVSDCLPPYAIVRGSVYDCGYMRVIATIRMDERLREGVELLAAAEGRSLSNMIEALVRQGLEGSGSSSSRTAVCANERFHRPGASCRSCGMTGVNPAATPFGGVSHGAVR